MPLRKRTLSRLRRALGRKPKTTAGESATTTTILALPCGQGEVCTPSSQAIPLEEASRHDSLDLSDDAEDLALHDWTLLPLPPPPSPPPPPPPPLVPPSSVSPSLLSLDQAATPARQPALRRRPPCSTLRQTYAQHKDPAATAGINPVTTPKEDEDPSDRCDFPPTTTFPPPLGATEWRNITGSDARSSSSGSRSGSSSSRRKRNRRSSSGLSPPDKPQLRAACCSCAAAGWLFCGLVFLAILVQVMRNQWSASDCFEDLGGRTLGGIFL
ncbi:hypothetical protein BX600DRAFT_510071 [Xylariales sp. PMI_506]|nr:hypothetical protein BX600DRAFT_510071 [Xylariales sp. PMI_506]